MDNTDIKDKLVLDPSDNAELAEYFSRCEPGEVLGRIIIDNAVFEENSPKVIVIGITGDAKITVEHDDKEKPGKKKKGEKGEEPENEGDDHSAAVEVYKSGGVPANEDNVPAESQPLR